MKKKSKQFIVGIVLCAIGVFGLFGLFVEQEDKASLAFGSLVFIAAGAIVLFLDYRRSAKAAAASAEEERIKSERIKQEEEAKAEKIRQEAAEKAAREEAMRKNEYYTFRVKGVTFSNGRKTRQAILRKIYFHDEPFEWVDWTLEQYDFEGSPAIGVYANGEQVGNVPKEKVPVLLERWDEIRSVYHAEVDGGGKDDFGKPINYGCEITLCLRKEKLPQ